MKEQLLEISVKINVLESLMRVLLEAMCDGENLKKYDTQNLAKIILQEIVTVKDSLNCLESEMGL